MYFKTYAPATKSENCETARAFHTFNAVRNFCGKDEPRFPDFVAYRLNKLGTMSLFIQLDPEELNAFETSLKPEWAEIRKLIREAGQPLREQPVAYFAILANNKVKKGQTTDLVQRYSNINRQDAILKLWYIPVDTEEASILAEEVIGNFFDHARNMKRCRGKDDYYECDEASAQRFITANTKDIYKAIMEAIEGI